MKNDLELSQIAAQSKGVISDETIVDHHPWVEDPEAEMAAINKAKQEAEKEISEMFPKTGMDPEEGEDGDT